MMLTAGLGVSGMMMVCLGTWCWRSRVVLEACSASLAPHPPAAQPCAGRQFDADPFCSTAQRGGVFSFTRLDRCGDSTIWEDDTSWVDTFLREARRGGKIKARMLKSPEDEPRAQSLSTWSTSGAVWSSWKRSCYWSTAASWRVPRPHWEAGLTGVWRDQSARPAAAWWDYNGFHEGGSSCKETQMIRVHLTALG